MAALSGLAEQVEGRILRGLAIWRVHRGRLEVDASGYWLVPSESEPGLLHRASPVEKVCDCADHRYSGHVCKHIWCAIFELALGEALPEIRFANNPCDARRAFGRRLR